MAGNDIQGVGNNEIVKSAPKETKSLKDIIAEARADSRLDRGELDDIMTKYEAEKKAITVATTTAQKTELLQVNALLVESLDDMFEEYELKGADDLKRIQNILNIVNPMRLANEKMGIVIAQDVTDYYKNGKEAKNIKLDSNGQLRFQKFYEGFFTTNSAAEVKNNPEALPQNDIDKVSKMLTTPNNMLRGSNPDFINFTKEAISNNPALSALSSISTSSVGDLHIGQLETIQGKPRISDIDDALKNGSPIADITRMIASIRLSSKPEDVDANVQAFLTKLQTSLKGPNPTLITPTSLVKKETQEQMLTNTKFVNADKHGTLLGNIKHISPEEKANLSTLLGKEVIDGRHDKSNGIGSAGKDKILVTVKDGNAIKIYEFKEQDQTHAHATLLNLHPNSERAEVAQKLWVDIKAVEINGKSYTQKEIVPGYVDFDPAKNPNDIKWASEALAVELAKLYTADGKGAEVLAQLTKTEVQEALKKVGGDYAKRTQDAFASARETYKDIVDENNKKDATKALEKKVDEVKKALESKNTPTLDVTALNTLKTALQSVIDKAKMNSVDTKDAELQMTALDKKITELAPKPTAAPVQAVAPTELNTDKYKAQISIFTTFLEGYKHFGTSFGIELKKNIEALVALKTILGINGENTTYKDIQTKTKAIQKELNIIKPDGAFGPDTLKKWIESEKYGRGKEITAAK